MEWLFYLCLGFCLRQIPVLQPQAPQIALRNLVPLKALSDVFVTKCANRAEGGGQMGGAMVSGCGYSLMLFFS